MITLDVVSDVLHEVLDGRRFPIDLQAECQQALKVFVALFTIRHHAQETLKHDLERTLSFFDSDNIVHHGCSVF